MLYLCSMIYNIQRFSTHDGEGIRTMVFYKGCPLRCEWCSNPEGQDFESSIMFDRKLCKNLRGCLEAGSSGIILTQEGIAINRSAIKDPEKLRNLCASGALTVVGEKKSIDEILHEIGKDTPFYSRSGGGVTLSGGEPLSEGPELTMLLLELKKREIDVAVETSLHVAWENVERTLGLVNTYLTDLKHSNRDIFMQYTTGDLDLVLGNLEKLAASKEHIIIRIPVIPGFNHTMPDMKALINYTASLQQVREIHFIPFHNLGTGKYKMLGMNYSFEHRNKVDASELSEYVQYAGEKGLKVKIGG